MSEVNTLAPPTVYICGRDPQTCLTIEAETVLHGGVGGRGRRRERQGEGLQGRTHDKERTRLRPGYVIWRKDTKERRW